MCFTIQSLRWREKLLFYVKTPSIRLWFEPMTLQTMQGYSPNSSGHPTSPIDNIINAVFSELSLSDFLDVEYIRSKGMFKMKSRWQHSVLMTFASKFLALKFFQYAGIFPSVYKAWSMLAAHFCESMTAIEDDDS